MGGIGAVCVLYGTLRLPPILIDLAGAGADVCVVDNSGDLESVTVPGVRVLRPGRNLGYSAGVNRGVRELIRAMWEREGVGRPIRETGTTEVASPTGPLGALLIVNPDIVGEAGTLVSFAQSLEQHSRPILAAPAHGDGYGFLPRASAGLTLLQYVARTSWHPTPKTDADRFLSGALLGLNSAALVLLSPEGDLLDESLFFMDDVELTDRARARGVEVTELVVAGTLRHVGGTSMRRRPAVRIYFSRVSKVRYWQHRSPWRGSVLRHFFRLETAVGRLRSARGDQGDGEVASGFRWASAWLRDQDGSIDDQVLGNKGAST